ncbi:MAG: hypothetical protein ABIO35_08360 [Nitrobacter sp.]
MIAPTIVAALVSAFVYYLSDGGGKSKLTRGLLAVAAGVLCGVAIALPSIH